MRVRSAEVLEATQITEEMVFKPELLPNGVRFGRRVTSSPDESGRRRLISYTLRAETTASGDYGPEFVFIGQWYVRSDNLSAVVDDDDFWRLYEEVGS